MTRELIFRWLTKHNIFIMNSTSIAFHGTDSTYYPYTPGRDYRPSSGPPMLLAAAYFKEHMGHAHQDEKCYMYIKFKVPERDGTDTMDHKRLALLTRSIKRAFPTSEWTWAGNGYSHWHFTHKDAMMFRLMGF